MTETDVQAPAIDEPDPREGALRVSLIAEQLFQDIPGGIGTYVRALLRRLPPLGVELEPVVARHRTATLASNGLPHARRLRYPRSVVYRRWTRGRGASAGRA